MRYQFSRYLVFPYINNFLFPNTKHRLLYEVVIHTSGQSFGPQIDFRHIFYLVYGKEYRFLREYWPILDLRC